MILLENPKFRQIIKAVAIVTVIAFTWEQVVFADGGNIFSRNNHNIQPQKRHLRIVNPSQSNAGGEIEALLTGKPIPPKKPLELPPAYNRDQLAQAAASGLLTQTQTKPQPTKQITGISLKERVAHLGIGIGLVAGGVFGALKAGVSLVLIPVAFLALIGGVIVTKRMRKYEVVGTRGQLQLVIDKITGTKDILGALHTGNPKDIPGFLSVLLFRHSYQDVKLALERNFGKPIEEILKDYGLSIETFKNSRIARLRIYRRVLKKNFDAYEFAKKSTEAHYGGGFVKSVLGSITNAYNETVKAANQARAPTTFAFIWYSFTLLGPRLAMHLFNSFALSPFIHRIEFYLLGEHRYDYFENQKQASAAIAAATKEEEEFQKTIQREKARPWTAKDVKASVRILIAQSPFIQALSALLDYTGVSGIAPLAKRRGSMYAAGLIGKYLVIPLLAHNPVIFFTLSIAVLAAFLYYSRNNIDKGKRLKIAALGVIAIVALTFAGPAVSVEYSIPVIGEMLGLKFSLSGVLSVVNTSFFLKLFEFKEKSRSKMITDRFYAGLGLQRLDYAGIMGYLDAVESGQIQMPISAVVQAFRRNIYYHRETKIRGFMGKGLLMQATDAEVDLILERINKIAAKYHIKEAPLEIDEERAKADIRQISRDAWVSTLWSGDFWAQVASSATMMWFVPAEIKMVLGEAHIADSLAGNIFGTDNFDVATRFAELIEGRHNEDAEGMPIAPKSLPEAGVMGAMDYLDGELGQLAGKVGQQAKLIAMGIDLPVGSPAGAETARSVQQKPIDILKTTNDVMSKKNHDVNSFIYDAPDSATKEYYQKYKQKGFTSIISSGWHNGAVIDGEAIKKQAKDMQAAGLKSVQYILGDDTSDTDTSAQTAQKFIVKVERLMANINAAKSAVGSGFKIGVVIDWEPYKDKMKDWQQDKNWMPFVDNIARPAIEKARANNIDLQFCMPFWAPNSRDIDTGALIAEPDSVRELLNLFRDNRIHILNMAYPSKRWMDIVGPEGASALIWNEYARFWTEVRGISQTIVIECEERATYSENEAFSFAQNPQALPTVYRALVNQTNGNIPIAFHFGSHTGSSAEHAKDILKSLGAEEMPTIRPSRTQPATVPAQPPRIYETGAELDARTAKPGANKAPANTILVNSKTGEITRPAPQFAVEFPNYPFLQGWFREFYDNVRDMIAGRSEDSLPGLFRDARNESEQLKKRYKQACKKEIEKWKCPFFGPGKDTNDGKKASRGVIVWSPWDLKDKDLMKFLLGSQKAGVTRIYYGPQGLQGHTQSIVDYLKFKMLANELGMAVVPIIGDPQWAKDWTNPMKYIHSVQFAGVSDHQNGIIRIALDIEPQALGDYSEMSAVEKQRLWKQVMKAVEATREHLSSNLTQPNDRSYKDVRVDLFVPPEFGTMGIKLPDGVTAQIMAYHNDPRKITDMARKCSGNGLQIPSPIGAYGIVGELGRITAYSRQHRRVIEFPSLYRYEEKAEEIGTKVFRNCSNDANFTGTMILQASDIEAYLEFFEHGKVSDFKRFQRETRDSLKLLSKTLYQAGRYVLARESEASSLFKQPFEESPVSGRLSQRLISGAFGLGGFCDAVDSAVKTYNATVEQGEVTPVLNKNVFIVGPKGGIMLWGGNSLMTCLAFQQTFNDGDSKAHNGPEPRGIREKLARYAQPEYANVEIIKIEREFSNHPDERTIIYEKGRELEDLTPQQIQDNSSDIAYTVTAMVPSEASKPFNGLIRIMFYNNDRLFPTDYRSKGRFIYPGREETFRVVVPKGKYPADTYIKEYVSLMNMTGGTASAIDAVGSPAYDMGVICDWIKGHRTDFIKFIDSAVRQYRLSPLSLYAVGSDLSAEMDMRKAIGFTSALDFKLLKAELGRHGINEVMIRDKSLSRAVAKVGLLRMKGSLSRNNDYQKTIAEEVLGDPDIKRLADFIRRAHHFGIKVTLFFNEEDVIDYGNRFGKKDESLLAEFYRDLTNLTECKYVGLYVNGLAFRVNTKIGPAGQDSLLRLHSRLEGDLKIIVDQPQPDLPDDIKQVIFIGRDVDGAAAKDKLKMLSQKGGKLTGAFFEGGLEGSRFISYQDGQAESKKIAGLADDLADEILYTLTYHNRGAIGPYEWLNNVASEGRRYQPAVRLIAQDFGGVRETVPLKVGLFSLAAEREDRLHKPVLSNSISRQITFNGADNKRVVATLGYDKSTGNRTITVGQDTKVLKEIAPVLTREDFAGRRFANEAVESAPKQVFIGRENFNIRANEYGGYNLSLVGSWQVETVFENDRVASVPYHCIMRFRNIETGDFRVGIAPMNPGQMDVRRGMNLSFVDFPPGSYTAQAAIQPMDKETAMPQEGISAPFAVYMNTASGKQLSAMILNDGVDYQVHLDAGNGEPGVDIKLGQNPLGERTLVFEKDGQTSTIELNDIEALKWRAEDFKRNIPREVSFTAEEGKRIIIKKDENGIYSVHLEGSLYLLNIFEREAQLSYSISGYQFNIEGDGNTAAITSIADNPGSDSDDPPSYLGVYDKNRELRERVHGSFRPFSIAVAQGWVVIFVLSRLKRLFTLVIRQWWHERIAAMAAKRAEDRRDFIAQSQSGTSRVLAFEKWFQIRTSNLTSKFEAVASARFPEQWKIIEKMIRNGISGAILASAQIVDDASATKRQILHPRRNAFLFLRTLAIIYAVVSFVAPHFLMLFTIVASTLSFFVLKMAYWGKEGFYKNMLLSALIFAAAILVMHSCIPALVGGLKIILLSGWDALSLFLEPLFKNPAVEGSTIAWKWIMALPLTVSMHKFLNPVAQKSFLENIFLALNAARERKGIGPIDSKKLDAIRIIISVLFFEGLSFVMPLAAVWIIKVFIAYWAVIISTVILSGIWTGINNYSRIKKNMAVGLRLPTKSRYEKLKDLWENDGNAWLSRAIIEAESTPRWNYLTDDQRLEVVKAHFYNIIRGYIRVYMTEDSATRFHQMPGEELKVLGLKLRLPPGRKLEPIIALLVDRPELACVMPAIFITYASPSPNTKVKNAVFRWLGYLAYPLSVLKANYIRIFMMLQFNISMGDRAVKGLEIDANVLHMLTLMGIEVHEQSFRKVFFEMYGRWLWGHLMIRMNARLGRRFTRFREILNTTFVPREVGGQEQSANLTEYVADLLDEASREPDASRAHQLRTAAFFAALQGTNNSYFREGELALPERVDLSLQPSPDPENPTNLERFGGKEFVNGLPGVVGVRVGCKQEKDGEGRHGEYMYMPWGVKLSEEGNFVLDKNPSVLFLGWPNDRNVKSKIAGAGLAFLQGRFSLAPRVNGRNKVVVECESLQDARVPQIRGARDETQRQREEIGDRKNRVLVERALDRKRREGLGTYTINLPPSRVRGRTSGSEAGAILLGGSRRQAKVNLIPVELGLDLWMKRKFILQNMNIARNIFNILWSFKNRWLDIGILTSWSIITLGLFKAGLFISLPLLGSVSLSFICLITGLLVLLYSFCFGLPTPVSFPWLTQHTLYQGIKAHYSAMNVVREVEAIMWNEKRREAAKGAFRTVLYNRHLEKINALLTKNGLGKVNDVAEAIDDDVRFAVLLASDLQLEHMAVGEMRAKLLNNRSAKIGVPRVGDSNAQLGPDVPDEVRQLYSEFDIKDSEDKTYLEREWWRYFRSKKQGERFVKGFEGKVTSLQDLKSWARYSGGTYLGGVRVRSTLGNGVPLVAFLESEEEDIEKFALDNTPLQVSLDKTNEYMAEEAAQQFQNNDRFKNLKLTAYARRTGKIRLTDWDSHIWTIEDPVLYGWLYPHLNSKAWWGLKGRGATITFRFVRMLCWLGAIIVKKPLVWAWSQFFATPYSRDARVLAKDFGVTPDHLDGLWDSAQWDLSVGSYLSPGHAWGRLGIFSRAGTKQDSEPINGITAMILFLMPSHLAASSSFNTLPLRALDFVLVLAEDSRFSETNFHRPSIRPTHNAFGMHYLPYILGMQQSNAADEGLSRAFQLFVGWALDEAFKRFKDEVDKELGDVLDGILGMRAFSMSEVDAPGAFGPGIVGYGITDHTMNRLFLKRVGPFVTGHQEAYWEYKYYRKLNERLGYQLFNKIEDKQMEHAPSSPLGFEGYPVDPWEALAETAAQAYERSIEYLVSSDFYLSLPEKEKAGFVNAAYEAQSAMNRLNDATDSFISAAAAAVGLDETFELRLEEAGRIREEQIRTELENAKSMHDEAENHRLKSEKDFIIYLSAIRRLKKAQEAYDNMELHIRNSRMSVVNNMIESVFTRVSRAKEAIDKNTALILKVFEARQANTIQGIHKDSIKNILAITERIEYITNFAKIIVQDRNNSAREEAVRVTLILAKKLFKLAIALERIKTYLVNDTNPEPYNRQFADAADDCLQEIDACSNIIMAGDNFSEKLVAKNKASKNLSVSKKDKSTLTDDLYSHFPQLQYLRQKEEIARRQYEKKKTAAQEALEKLSEAVFLRNLADSEREHEYKAARTRYGRAKRMEEKAERALERVGMREKEQSAQSRYETAKTATQEALEKLSEAVFLRNLADSEREHEYKAARTRYGRAKIAEVKSRQEIYRAKELLYRSTRKYEILRRKLLMSLKNEYNLLTKKLIDAKSKLVSLSYLEYAAKKSTTSSIENRINKIEARINDLKSFPYRISLIDREIEKIKIELQRTEEQVLLAKESVARAFSDRWAAISVGVTAADAIGVDDSAPLQKLADGVSFREVTASDTATGIAVEGRVVYVDPDFGGAAQVCYIPESTAYNFSKYVITPDMAKQQWAIDAGKTYMQFNGLTVSEVVEGYQRLHPAGKMEDILAVINGHQGNFNDPNTVLIINGKLITRKENVLGLFQDKPGVEYNLLNGTFDVFSLDKGNVGLKKVSIANNELVDSAGIQNGIHGQVLVSGGDSVVDNNIIQSQPALHSNEVNWPLDTKAAFTAIGKTKDGKIVVSSFKGKPGKNEINLNELADAMIGLDAVEAVLLGGSADVQNYVQGQPYFKAEASVTSATAGYERKLGSFIFITAEGAQAPPVELHLPVSGKTTTAAALGDASTITVTPDKYRQRIVDSTAYVEMFAADVVAQQFAAEKVAVAHAAGKIDEIIRALMPEGRYALILHPDPASGDAAGIVDKLVVDLGFAQDNIVFAASIGEAERCIDAYGDEIVLVVNRLGEAMDKIKRLLPNFEFYDEIGVSGEAAAAGKQLGSWL